MIIELTKNMDIPFNQILSAMAVFLSIQQWSHLGIVAGSILSIILSVYWITKYVDEFILRKKKKKKGK
ncbi:MAG: hypothetical protein ACQER7_03705 [Bacteroidota bacterium]